MVMVKMHVYTYTFKTEMYIHIYQFANVIKIVHERERGVINLQICTEAD